MPDPIIPSQDPDAQEKNAILALYALVKPLLAKHGLYGIVAAGLLYWNNQHSNIVAHNTLWNEGGQHFQDLVDTNTLQETEIKDLKARISQLENSK